MCPPAWDQSQHQGAAVDDHGRSEKLLCGEPLVQKAGAHEDRYGRHRELDADRLGGPDSGDEPG